MLSSERSKYGVKDMILIWATTALCLSQSLQTVTMTIVLCPMDTFLVKKLSMDYKSRLFVTNSIMFMLFPI